jgi:hypothetical protein
MDTCSAVMLSGHKPQVADAVIEARNRIVSVSVSLEVRQCQQRQARSEALHSRASPQSPPTLPVLIRCSSGYAPVSIS